MRGVRFIAWPLFVSGAIATGSVMAEFTALLEVGKFSTATVGQAIPDGWKPLTFKKIPKHTSYEVVKDGGVTIVKAVSEASASGLIKQVVDRSERVPDRSVALENRQRASAKRRGHQGGRRLPGSALHHL